MNSSFPGGNKRAFLTVVLAVVCGVTANSQTIINPSFEVNTFTVAPGLVSDNTAITGWVANPDYSAGLNSAGMNQYADNGAIPDGKNVAFIQANGTTLSTTIDGLIVGKTYKIDFRVGATAGQTPNCRVSMDDLEVLAVASYPVSTNNPYAHLAFEFNATAASQNLTLLNDASGDATLLVDNFTIVPSSGKVVVDAWTGDEDSGVDGQYVYTHAYSFGSASSTVINNIPFTGVAGANPAVAGKFSTVHFPNTFTGDANNVAGAGKTLATDFVYSGANITAGTYETINLQGLTPGLEYVATVYTVAFDDPTPAVRWATMSVGDDRLTVNQDQFGNNNGLRISFRYLADTNGTASINIAPLNPVNMSVHIYGFSNREAVSRNVAPTFTQQPASTTVSQGVAVTFSAAATGFPTPTYRWRFNNANIAGATEATYSIAQATSQSAGKYDVVIANSSGSVTSVVASLVVGIPMNNPSFEADTFTEYPGYSNANGPITDWTLDDEAGAGLNPAGSSPFADNGAIPNGVNVAFIQADEKLSQTVSGLTVGSQFYLHYYENSRTTVTPSLEVKLGAETLVPAHAVPPVGGSNPYREVYSDVFVSAVDSLDLAFVKSNPLGGDSTVLIDNIAFVEVKAGTAPFVSLNPAAVKVFTGDSATFTAQGIGSLPLTYQWLKNGSVISGATSATLTLTDVKKSDEADYSVTVSNSAGKATSSTAHLTVSPRIPGLYNSGVANDRTVLADNEVDPHYQLIDNPDTGSLDALVEDSTVFPISDGTWLKDTTTSKWIGPKLNTADSAVGLYTYRTTIDLTGLDPKSVVILGRWAVDNAGRDIRVNGVSTGNPEASGFSSFVPFAIYGTNVNFTAGTNTIDFVVENVDAIGYTGLRLEIVESSVQSASTQGPKLMITRTGDSISISWTPVVAGQRLQSATDLNGPWKEIVGASIPYIPMSAGTLFYRIAQ